MEIIAKNFRDFLLEFDTFIIDLYRTIEDETGNYIRGVEQNLKFLAKNKKRVIIFTNYPKSNKQCFENSKLLTYFVMICVMYVLKMHNPFMSAIIPRLRFVLSTLSVSFINKIWIQEYYK